MVSNCYYIDFLIRISTSIFAKPTFLLKEPVHCNLKAFIFYFMQLKNNVVLQPGDLILTGTPSGVGPVVAGDIITGKQHLALKPSLCQTISPPLKLARYIKL
jgi:hypothetical protein